MRRIIWFSIRLEAVIFSYFFFYFSTFGIEPCRIEIVEEECGWPVPLVELTTTHQVHFVSDNAGLIAFDLPELMNQPTWFEVSGNGYEVAKDGFGIRGVRLTPIAGKTQTVRVKRTIVARRMGRLTGGGIFGESQKLGLEKDWEESGILGQDSVQNAVYNGKLFWAWGDTIIPSYSLGIFDMSSATTSMQPLASMEPPLRLKLQYFRTSDKKVRGVAKMPGPGPTWLSGYVTLRDAKGIPHLVATYQKIRNYLECYEAGQCVWDDQTETFKLLKVVWTKDADHQNLPHLPEGHTAFWKDENGKEWVGFGNPFPSLRCPATYESWQNEKEWELLKPQASLPDANEKPVIPHSGSITYNAFRKKWVTIFMEKMGKPSGLGEIWYAEANSALGPWDHAIKVVSHENYTFYNPRIHPEFTPENSPILFFEGTYTAEFSNSKVKTPRYDYNQILYRLDLDREPISARK
ncbi:MAG: hypothetical protein JWM04_1152 [Verrucomicrobiales bacterium]|nr:hypothetical protein [Verrucomicrobiales bacterium]